MSFRMVKKRKEECKCLVLTLKGLQTAVESHYIGTVSSAKDIVILLPLRWTISKTLFGKADPNF